MGIKLSAVEVAQIVGRNERNVREWIRKGKLKAGRKEDGHTLAIDLDDLMLIRGISIDSEALARIQRLRVLPANPHDTSAALVDRIAQLERQLAKLSSGLVTSKVEAAPLPVTLRATTDEVVTPAPTPTYMSGFGRPASRTIRLSEGGLPKGLVSWFQFSKLHGIAPSTVKDAVLNGKLPTVRGNWKVGNAYVKGALDGRGQQVFYQLWGGRHDFVRCSDCPHSSPVQE